MKKIIVLEWLTLDGYFSGPNEETNWFVMDEITQEHLLKLFRSADTILLGRVTYELFTSYWPTPASSKENPAELVDFMNNSRKIVFSSSLEKPEWNNAELTKSIDQAAIREMKQGPGKDMIIFGSGSIVSRLTKLQLIDQYHFLINPVFIGAGKPVFKNDEAKSKLKLLDTKTFDCGNILLQYELDKK